MTARRFADAGHINVQMQDGEPCSAVLILNCQDLATVMGCIPGLTGMQKPNSCWLTLIDAFACWGLHVCEKCEKPY